MDRDRDQKRRVAPPRRPPEDFEARLAEHRGILFRLANTYCPAGEDREDLVQEICLQLWRAYPRYDSERRFSTWMYRVAFNTAISYSRAHRVRTKRIVPWDRSAVEVPAPASVSEGDEGRLARVVRFLRGLGELDRALVVLYLEERSYREIAEVLGISESNVGTKLSRLKTRMRQTLAPNRENEDGA